MNMAKEKAKKIYSIILSLIIIFSMVGGSVVSSLALSERSIAYSADNSTLNKDGIDVENLPDGEYKVGVQLVKPGYQEDAENNVSDAVDLYNKLLDKTGVLKVVNGKPSIELDIGEFTTFGMNIYLKSLDYHKTPLIKFTGDHFKTVGKYPAGMDGWRQYDKDYEAVNVISTKQAESGDTRLSKISFEVPEYALKKGNGYVSLRREGSSLFDAGKNPALLRITWDGDDDYIALTPVKYYAVERTMKDEATGIMVKGKFPYDSKLTVKKLPETDEAVKAVNDKKNRSVLEAYDVSVDKHEGPVEVTFPADKKYNDSNLYIYHANGETKEYKANVSDEKVKVTVGSPSKFIIAKKKSSLNYNNLSDGEYSVNVRVVKSSGESLSMANNAVIKPAKIIVKDGKYNLRLQFTPLKAMNLKGYLGDMLYLTEEGNFERVNIIDYYDDKDDFFDVYKKYIKETYGDDALKNLKYPKTVEYPISVPTTNEQITTTKVFVAVMESIMSGAGTKKCRPIIEWDTIEETPISKAKKAKLAEIDKITVGDTEGMTAESIEKAEAKLDELKEAAKKAVNDAEDVDSVNAVTVDVEEARALLVSKEDAEKEALKKAKEAKLAEIEEISLSEADKAGKTEESIKAAEAKLDELKEAAKAAVESATTVDQVHGVVVDIDEAISLLEDKSEITDEEKLENAKNAKLEEIEKTLLSDADKDGKTEESIKAAEAKLAELKNAAKAAVESANSIDEVDAVKIDMDAVKALLEEKTDPVDPIPEYNVIEGNNQVVDINNLSNVSFKFDADYSKFENGGKVYVDGKLLKPEDYISKTGSTIISLKKDFVEKLSVGEHTVKVAFNDGGEAEARFKIAKAEAKPDETKKPSNEKTHTSNISNSPKTGDETGMAVVLILVVMASAIVAAVARRKQK